jgi:membrane-associated protein
VSAVLDNILGAPGWVVYVVVGMVVFAEDALFVGFVIPGETVAILGGVAASRGHASVVVVAIVVVAAAIVGDSVGYEIGKHWGARLLDLRAFAKHRRRLQDAQDLLARRGGIAVFLGRWVAFFRAVMPALAGTAKMPYRTFLPFNAAGGIVWGTVVVLVGYLAAHSYAQVERTIGRDAALVALVVVLALVAVWQVRRRRAAAEPTEPGAR